MNRHTICVLFIVAAIGIPASAWAQKAQQPQPVTVVNTSLPVAWSTALPVNVAPSWTPVSELRTGGATVEVTGNNQASYAYEAVSAPSLITGITLHVSSDTSSREDGERCRARLRIANSSLTTVYNELIDLTVPGTGSATLPYVPLPNIYLEQVGNVVWIQLTSNTNGTCIFSYTLHVVDAT